jgi:hypothetical protein
MEQREFYKDLFIAISLSGILTLVALKLEVLSMYYSFALISISFFTAMTFGVYIIGTHLVRQSNKMLFTYFTMFVILAKLVLALILIIGFDRLTSPPNKFYVFLFLVHYLIFTIFEVKTLTRLSKTQ